MGFWTAIVAIVAISCVMGAVTSIFGSKNKHQEKNYAEQKDIDALKEDNTQLRERIETLESIVTDSSFDLKKQFEKLNEN
jgi:cell division protein FtsB